MSGIKSVIDALGYSKSDKLYYSDSNETMSNRSIHKLSEELAPAAIYMTDKKPFIVFIESNEKSLTEHLIKKVWNAQIPLLIVSFDNHIKVYNGCSINKTRELLLLEEIDNTLINEGSLFSFWNISSAAFWKRYQKELSAPKLDAVMLDNIRDATYQLKKTECEPFAVKIILRLIFIRYLIDRGVDLAYHGLCGNVTSSQTQLLTIMQDKAEMYGFFAHLKKSFNGNLFELYEKGNRSEIDILDDSSLRTLRDLMAGDLVLPSGQTSLFPLYDFNIIPVELISNIYERFLGDEKQQKDKAFYTPPYLVDYLLEETIAPFLKENTNCRILDPACGSGIFLVQSARKIIEKNITQDADGFSDQRLVYLIKENIWGIDKNPEAIDVAIFSIYLTILDYKDPKTLRNFKLPLLRDTNFFVCDFFSEDIKEHLEEKHFDFIVGNPPWGNVGGSHVKYCKERNLPHQGNEISRSFVLRTKDFADQNTCCCLIVTSKLLYNTKSPSVSFRKWLLEKARLKKYIELAAVRELIFASARGPAGVLIYQFNDNDNENKKHDMCHLTLKPNIFFKLFNIIVIDKNDYKYVPQTLLLENDWAWKTLVFGHTHDFHTIKGLYNRYLTVEQVIRNNKLKHGTGIRVADGEKQNASHLIGRWLIDAKKGIKPFEVIKEKGKYFTKSKVHRAKEDKQYLFQSPYTLIKKGFNTQNYKFRAAYSEEDFLYTDAITGICGEEKNKEILLSLTGLFNSSFYSYLNLMLGSSSGIECEQGFPTEIFKYPIVIDNQISYLTEQIQGAIKAEKDYFNNSNESDELIRKLDNLVLEKFGLADDIFVDYALKIQIPQVAKNKIFWENVSSNQLSEYVKIFTEYFAKIFTQNQKYISVHIYKYITGHYCGVEFVFQDNAPSEPIIEHDGKRDAQMSFVSKFMLNKVNDLFYQSKDVISFSENSFYILKTDEYKNWHPAMAKLDLADVLDSILADNEVSHYERI
ncbi:MAG: N-6 DNA methylase [Syntrophomonadaceae bacterium]|nr:N-6 DNA methylase [Syntrophomonadaceae bacterium]